MTNPSVGEQSCERLFPCVGIMVAVLFSMAGPVLGNGAVEAVDRSENQAAFPPESKTIEKQNSPLIGSGVRTPPDIGASGTASSTPPVRTESPTDEPHILPDVSSAPPHPLAPESAPNVESPPIGQPDHLQRMQE
ncbi:MAG: hypothetical protein H0W49_10855 [Nitrospirales bacterium]|nr:hypothetical protein [Nitrospirales bacterium]